jgi:hypothetical protein
MNGQAQGEDRRRDRRRIVCPPVAPPEVRMNWLVITRDSGLAPPAPKRCSVMPLHDGRNVYRPTTRPTVETARTYRAGSESCVAPNIHFSSRRSNGVITDDMSTRQAVHRRSRPGPDKTIIVNRYDPWRGKTVFPVLFFISRAIVRQRMWGLSQVKIGASPPVAGGPARSVQIRGFLLAFKEPPRV